MSRQRAARKLAHRPQSQRALSIPTWLVLAALTLLVLISQRHTLGLFFALDDLVMFQQAAGVREWPLTPWRWLSGWAWFRAVVPLWGHEPFPYHAASLVLHMVNTLLLYRLARKLGASAIAAFVGVGLFAVSRLHFPALLAATSIGELLSLTGTLAALLLARAGTRPQLAALAFALAISAKESVMLVPLALLLLPRGQSRERSHGLRPLVVTGAVLGAALLASGMASGRLGGQAYAVSFGANLLENVARLFGWTVDLVDPIPDLHAATVGATRFVLPLLAVLLTALAWRLKGVPLARVGAAWWWLAVLPVLPLPGRTYLHYLYVPLAGSALLLAAAWDAAHTRWVARTRSPATPGRAAWAAAAVLMIVYTAWSDVLIATRIDLRMSSTGWPLDPVLRKSEMARRGISDVRDALAGAHARVAILIPASISHNVDLGSGRVSLSTPVTRYAVEEVLDGGGSVRAFVPNADAVEFVHDYEPGRDGWQLFLSLSDAHVVPLGELPAAHARFVQAMLTSGYPAAALDYTEKALVDRPGDPELTALREQASVALVALKPAP